VVSAGYYGDRREFPIYGWAVRRGVPTSCLGRVLSRIGGYNEFYPEVVAREIVALDPDDELVWHVGREFSVVLYGRGNPALLRKVADKAKALHADESDIENGALRLWWD